MKTIHLICNECFYTKDKVTKIAIEVDAPSYVDLGSITLSCPENPDHVMTTQEE